MARFGQGFLQALTQPSYGQGLFELGSAIGSAPAINKEKEARQKMLQQFMQGSPLQQGRVLQQEGLRTGNLSMVAQGKQLEDKALDAGVQQGIDAIKARMMKMPDEQLDAAQANLEKYVRSVGGNVLDVANVATEIRQQRQQQELNQYKVDEARREQAEKKVIETFFAVPQENRAKFLEGATQKGFGDLAAKLEQRELERTVENERLQGLIGDKTKPVDTGPTRSRIEALSDGRVREDLLAQLEAIEAEIPNFKEGETFDVGGRKTLIGQLDSLNTSIARAAANLDQADLISGRQLENDIRNIRARAANFKPTKTAIEAKAKELEDKSDKWFDSYKDYLLAAEQALIEERVKEAEKLIADLQGEKTNPEESSDQGSIDNPYEPTTKEDLDKIPSGQYYINPNTKQKMRKA